ncbi:alpha-amylase [Salipaludibacillus sp. HK11]|uniref:alpha-amylase n=1 Tax=Salipaludibacillus sp. HK11 TaxID=3394320 RepID=UPI0039FCF72A
MTKRNQTMMQFFEWHLINDGDHWNRLTLLASELESHGINALWIPPATKGTSQADNGYGIYDAYDLGEFDQKNTVRTKYGTKDELIKGIQACHQHNIRIYADVVMNHLAGADETETFEVVEVDADDRHEVVSEPFEIEGWTKFTFPGRAGVHSSFQWNFHHFNGTDYDESRSVRGIYRILGDHKRWNHHVDNEFGNYDYLMFANIDYHHPEVRTEMIHWGKWFAEVTACNGFRLDAIKHINHQFLDEFISDIREEFGEKFYFVGEYWNPDLEACSSFLESVDYQIDLFDVGLHYRFYEASLAKSDFDMRGMFDDTLVAAHPMNAVTFVDNHDSQPGESLESWIGDWFKPLAYALILLRKDGYPCLFYGDYIGISGDDPIQGKKEIIDPLLDARNQYAYGEQHDYFDHKNTIGWVRLGDKDIDHSGCAVIISNGEDGHKKMFVGEERAQETWIDLTNNSQDTIVIDDNGYGEFTVKGESVSVYIAKQ